MFKKRKLLARTQMFRWTGRSVPAHRQKLLPPIRADYMDMAKFYAARYALSGNRRILGGLFRLIRSLKRKELSDRSVRAEAFQVAGTE